MYDKDKDCYICDECHKEIEAGRRCLHKLEDFHADCLRKAVPKFRPFGNCL